MSTVLRLADTMYMIHGYISTVRGVLVSGPVQAVVGCCALKDAERRDALRQIESLTVSTAHQQRASHGQHPRNAPSCIFQRFHARRGT